MNLIRTAQPASLALVLAVCAPVGCSPSDGPTGESRGGANSVSGGRSSGGMAASTGGSATSGGAMGTGGANGGTSGGTASFGGAPGGANSGGANSSGAPGGGANSGGGSATGGMSTGGAATAGASSGGGMQASGGRIGAGGAAAGGSASGGANSGGNANRGGNSAGGASAGGTTTCPASGGSSTTATSLTVQLSNQYRPVTHAASGSLYGLANDGSPSDALIGPTKPFMFTQMAPNGQQLGNGATTPTGDALKVAAAAARAGAKITIRMPDSYPNFPYQWVSWNDWYARVDAMVTATLNSGATNIYAYEIWNEPNWTWNNPNQSGTTFNEAWRNTYQRIRAKDTKTKILGPSPSLWDANFMQSFLSYCKTNNCLPDIVCWHELGEPEGSHVDTPRPNYIPAHIAAYRAMETSLGIGKHPISINEYGVIPEEGVPGSMIRYIAHFERQGVESANIAYWHQSGRLSDLITNRGAANGGWWLYKFYGDMSGQMAMTTPPATAQTALGLDGIASVDANAQRVDVVLGGGSGNIAVVVQGLSALGFFGCNAHVKAETAAWNGVDSAVAAPSTLLDAQFPINNGQIIVPLANVNNTAAYRLVITPG